MKKYPLSVHIMRHPEPVDPASVPDGHVFADDLIIIAAINCADGGVLYDSCAVSGQSDSVDVLDIFRAWLILGAQIEARLEPGPAKTLCKLVADCARTIWSPKPPVADVTPTEVNQ